jgi:hypothetical protein
MIYFLNKYYFVEINMSVSRLVTYSTRRAAWPSAIGQLELRFSRESLLRRGEHSYEQQGALAILRQCVEKTSAAVRNENHTSAPSSPFAPDLVEIVSDLETVIVSLEQRPMSPPSQRNSHALLRKIDSRN